MNEFDESLGKKPEWLCGKGESASHHWDSCPDCLRNRIHFVYLKPEGNTMSEKLRELEELEQAIHAFQGWEPQLLKFQFRNVKYVLIEASEDAAVKYRNAAMKAARMLDGKVVGLDGAADVEPVLVSLCLYYATESGEMPVKEGNADPSRLVPLPIVRTSWPSNLVKKLYKWVIQTSNLREDEEETKESLLRKQAEIRSKLALLEAGTSNQKQAEEQLKN